MSAAPSRGMLQSTSTWSPRAATGRGAYPGIAAHLRGVRPCRRGLRGAARPGARRRGLPGRRATRWPGGSARHGGSIPGRRRRPRYWSGCPVRGRSRVPARGLVYRDREATGPGRSRKWRAGVLDQTVHVPAALVGTHFHHRALDRGHPIQVGHVRDRRATRGSRRMSLALPDRVRGAHQDAIVFQARPRHQFRGEPSARSVDRCT